MMGVAEGDTTISVGCPRCGYDQRGAMAMWGDKGSCPVEGTCTECGLTFLWRDLLRPTFSEPRWCVEHAPRRVRPLARSVVGTFARSWLPWVFWRRVQLQHQVRLRRILLYLFACVVLPSMLLYLATQISVAVTVRYVIGTEDAGFVQSPDDIQSMIDRVEEYIVHWTALEDFADATTEHRIRAVVWPRFRAGDMTEWPDDLEELIADLDQDSWAPLWREHLAESETDLEFLKQMLAGEWGVDMSYWRAITEAVFTPWRSTSAGQIVDAVGTISAYPAPRELHVTAFSFQSTWGYFDWIDVAQAYEEVIGPPVLWIVLTLTYPLTFLFLPITRRRAKVRWIHFARIALYSVMFPIVLLIAALGVQTAALMWWQQSDSVWLAAVLLAATAPMPVLLAWWYCAIRLHLRLPNALAVTLIMALLNGLVVLPVIGVAGAMLVK